MKLNLNQVFRLPCALIALAAVFPVDSHGANYYYDMSRPSGSAWLGADIWSTEGTSGPFNASWVDGNTANFMALATNYTIAVGSGNTVDFGSGGISRAGTGIAATIISGGTVKFKGATIYAGSSSSQVLKIQSPSQGTFSLTGGLLQLESSVAFDGTATVSGGTLSFTSTTASSNKSNVKIAGGSMNSEVTGSSSYGSLEITAGTYSIGKGSGTDVVDVTLASLSGSGSASSVVGMRQNSNAAAVVNSLTVDQATDTVFGGRLRLKVTSGPAKYATFTKKGAGTLRFSYTVDALAGTTVSGGTLLFSGDTYKIFDNIPGEAESAAITVASGGTLGASTTLTINASRNVIVEEGGAISGGDGVGAVGTMTLFFDGTALTTGKLDLTDATAASGWLKFDLGAATTAGATYDQIRLTSGTMEIGSGLLGFNDFSFNPLAGFGEGTYTLFDFTGTGALSGTLGTSLTGNINNDYLGRLYSAGNNILLDVTAVPEPAAGMLGLLGGVAGLLFYRCRSGKGANPASVQEI